MRERLYFREFGFKCMQAARLLSQALEAALSP